MKLAQSTKIKMTQTCPYCNETWILSTDRYYPMATTIFEIMHGAHVINCEVQGWRS